MTQHTVRIVEDEKISSLFLENVLTEWGYRVTATASTGAEAVRAAAAEPIVEQELIQKLNHLLGNTR